MPNDLPPWAAVYQQTQRWLAAGCFEALVDDLRAVLRLAAGRKAEPTAAIIDSRTLRSTPESGERAGYDGGKRKRGPKIHMAVDTPGHLLALHVTPASAEDRGDPKKQVGILNNPLYRGRPVWSRREWRKDPDSEGRERRYRLRYKSEWIEVAMPDLSIVDRDVAAGVDRELGRRSTPVAAKRGNGKRERHLLSGLIKCGECGLTTPSPARTTTGAPARKERGTCGSKLSVRVAPLEEGVLVALQKQPLTADMAKMFVAEFRRELARILKAGEEVDRDAERRLEALEAELASLSENLLVGVVGPTITSMIAAREAERESLMARVATRTMPMKADIVPHPALLRRFEARSRV